MNNLQQHSFQEVEHNGTKYKCRYDGRITVGCRWASVEAFDWIDGHGWDSNPVKRPETLIQLDLVMQRPRQ